MSQCREGPWLRFEHPCNSRGDSAEIRWALDADFIGLVALQKFNDLAEPTLQKFGQFSAAQRMAILSGGCESAASDLLQTA